MVAAEDLYQWDPFKNAWLKAVRGVSFEEILRDPVVRVRGSKQRSHQAFFLIDRGGYIWMVPYVQSEGGVYLKTAFPSRRLTKLYQQGAL